MKRKHRNGNGKRTKRPRAIAPPLSPDAVSYRLRQYGTSDPVGHQYAH